MKKIYTFLFALFAMVNVVEAQNVGDLAPDFTLKDLSNANYTLSENRGKVHLVFLVGYNCPLCISSAPTVQSTIINAFSSNSKFQALVIDVWNGGTSSVQGFKNTTGMTAKYLQKGSSVASNWSTTYDRLVVIDAEGKIAYKGNSAARTNANAAKSAVQTALDNTITTALPFLHENEVNELRQNYPNPMQNETKISFRLAKAAEVNLTVYDITGKAIAIVTDGFYPAGEHEVNLYRNDFKTGIYLYKLNAGEFTATKRMIVQ